ncbi:hypothetical protein HYPSUDRAFT_86960 [Hypholoma sublateritium FD-334 SS-4]|uniref:Uncharacterized protein n=1 Tax=Hypholoma sublateritium (strain FD-334 SS-4) TaxID=945553 RepID=A0A0D2L7J0_HYPSF|nr:hypothetical protein HYPSUDRAFT_86960 [Hypholoma sublateritium FD-334 SS-4]
MSQFPNRFPPGITGRQYVQWAEESFGKELEQYHIQRKKFEEQQDKWKAEKAKMEEKLAREIQEEIMKAWMRNEEEQWKKQLQEFTQARNDLLTKHAKDVEDIRNGRNVAIKPVFLESSPRFGFYGSHGWAR